MPYWCQFDRDEQNWNQMFNDCWMIIIIKTLLLYYKMKFIDCLYIYHYYHRLYSLRWALAYSGYILKLINKFINQFLCPLKNMPHV
jgi:hypothetical protein